MIASRSFSQAKFGFRFSQKDNKGFVVVVDLVVVDEVVVVMVVKFFVAVDVVVDLVVVNLVVAVVLDNLVVEVYNLKTNFKKIAQIIRLITVSRLDNMVMKTGPVQTVGRA